MEITVADLVQRFDSGEIRLPLMQRDYVWKASKVEALLDSLYQGWPVGSFYVWQTKDSYPARERAGRVAPARSLDGFYGFLLDGQQRLTSLWLALQGDSDGDPAARAFFDVESEEFFLGTKNRTVTRRVEARDPLLVPLSELVILSVESEAASHAAVDAVLDALRDQGKLRRGDTKETDFRRRLYAVAAMLRRRALCEEFRDDDEDHAFTLFARLNKGGTSLQTGDVAAARLASTATKRIVGPMRAFVSEREARALGINFVFVLRALITVYRGNCSFAKLPRSWASDADEVEASWRLTERGLRSALDVVRNELGWRSRRWLPSLMALIPLVYVFAKKGTARLDAEEATLVRNYLLITGLRSLFRGASETAVNSYVNAVRGASSDRTQCLKELVRRIPKNRRQPIQQEDILASSGTYSPLMQIYLAYLCATGVRSWPSGTQLISDRGEQQAGVAVHRIFPKELAAELGIPVDRFSTAANYVVVNAADAAVLQGEQPLESWNRMRPSQRQSASAQLCIGDSTSLLQPEKFLAFLEHRAEALSTCLNSYLGLE